MVQHEAGKGAKYTRGRGPLSLVYWQWCGDKSAALTREAQIKKLSRVQKLGLVAGSGTGFDSDRRREQG